MKATNLSHGSFLKALLPGLVMISGLLLSQTAGAAAGDLAGSAHDFSAAGWNTATDQICIFCHAPHNAVSPADGPLWNHDTSGITNYVMYGEGTAPPGSDLDGTGFGTQPNGVSKLCLSCHDGTVAVDSFGGRVGGTDMDTINAAANLGGTGGTELDNDHPIGFTWPTAGADNEIALKSVPQGHAPPLPLFGTGTDQMECATCHDVHATGDAKTNNKLLRVSESASEICLVCHLK